MIYSFDPGHQQVGYACMDPITEKICAWGLLSRDPEMRSYFFSDMKDIVTGTKDWPFPITVALIEGQYIKKARSSKVQTAIAAATLKVRTVAIEILTVFELFDVDCHLVHPKTWQGIFKKEHGWLFGYPKSSPDVKEASKKMAEEVTGAKFTKSLQDMADAICIMHWYKTIGKEQL